MLWRLFFFLGLQLPAVGLGGWAWGLQGALTGAVLAAWLAFILESWRGLQLLAWLRQGAQMSQAPSLRGLWGETADRLRRLLRERERQLQASELRLAEFLAALQASPNGVLLLDEQGHIEWFNQMAAEHFGLELARDLQQSIGNLLREPAFASYWAAEDFSAGLLLPGRQSTASHPVQLAVQIHPYGQGRRLMLSRDVTQLEQAEAMRRDIVANVSHEIRTPLTVLSGFIETLQTLALTPQERTRYLGLMAQQAARMQNVVQDLLTLSRLEGSPLPDFDQWTPVDQLLAQCEQQGRALCEVLAGPAGERHLLHFEQVAGAATVALAGSRQELLSAMFNLLSNAIRYTPAGGRIDVRWHLLPDGRGEFAVHDSGPGIAPEHLARLTERFYRVDRSRSRDTGGTGLGLAIVKHVVQRHGAELQIDSKLGQGSRFAITFAARRLRVMPGGDVTAAGQASAA